MRKEKMVTRTIVSVECEVMCLNVQTAEVQILSLTVPKSVCTKGTLTALKNIYETDDFKVVVVQSEHEIEELYGMTESEFLAHSKKLPPRTGKTDDEIDNFIESLELKIE